MERLQNDLREAAKLRHPQMRKMMRMRIPSIATKKRIHPKKLQEKVCEHLPLNLAKLPMSLLTMKTLKTRMKRKLNPEDCPTDKFRLKETKNKRRPSRKHLLKVKPRKLRRMWTKTVQKMPKKAEFQAEIPKKVCPLTQILHLLSHLDLLVDLE